MRTMKVAALSLMLALIPSAHAGGMSSALLTSSAWGTFTYNKPRGYWDSKRVYFSANGTYGTGSQGQGYSSGSGGSMASQRNASGGGLWKVENGELFMAEGRGRLDRVGTV